MVLGTQNTTTRGKVFLGTLHRRPWLSVTIMVFIVALLSALSNLQLCVELTTAPEDMTQGLYIYHVIRRCVSMVLNTGTLWAGQLILAGWMVNRKPWWQWGLAGWYAGFLSLTVHYLISIALSHIPAFETVSFEIFPANLNWYLVVAVLGIPLGLLGGLIKGSATGIRVLPAYLIPLGAFGEALLQAYGFYRSCADEICRSDLLETIADTVTVVALLLVAFISAYFVHHFLSE